MNRFLTVTVAALTLIAPIASYAQSHPMVPLTHMRYAFVHDRAPHPHIRNVQPHH